MRKKTGSAGCQESEGRESDRSERERTRAAAVLVQDGGRSRQHQEQHGKRLTLWLYIISYALSVDGTLKNNEQ